MPKENKAQIRYRILDVCFRDFTREYTLQELLETVNQKLKSSSHPHKISERQLYSDISFMKSDDGYGAIIDSFRVMRTDSNGGKRLYSAYRYRDPNFSIEKIPMTQKQLRYLQLFISSFESTIDPDLLPWVKKTINSLKRWMGDFDAKPMFRYDSRGYQGGLRVRECYDYFQNILDAIDEHKSVWVMFKSGEIEKAYRFHPCFLKQFCNRWYALGVTTDNPDKVLVIPLDRILDMNVCRDPYINYPFDPDTYFEDFIGVFNPDGECVDVHLRFRGWGAKYFSTNPLHPSQRSKMIDVNGEEMLDVHIEVKINKELQRSLNAVIDCVEVLAPQELVELHKESVRKAMKLNGLDK